MTIGHLLQEIPTWDWWLQIPVGIALLAVTLTLALILGRALLMLIRLWYAAAFELALRSSDALVFLVTGIVGGGANVLLLGIRLAVWPVRWSWERFEDFYLEKTGNLSDRLAEHAELRRLWRHEYRHTFRTFRAFLEFYEAQQAGQRSDERRRDPFADACALFGLPPDGRFTRQELDRAYRRLMKEAHPDLLGGHTDATEKAAAINRAREIIKRQKGWV